jgi:hypothetical protein
LPAGLFLFLFLFLFFLLQRFGRPRFQVGLRVVRRLALLVPCLEVPVESRGAGLALGLARLALLRVQLVDEQAHATHLSTDTDTGERLCASHVSRVVCVVCRV